MPRRGDTKHDLTLRPVTGLLEDVALAVPVEWVETLRAQSVKLGMSLEDVGRPIRRASGARGRGDGGGGPGAIDGR